ncbi:MAG: sodium:calcium antiporter [Gammaproteobacteria bacterium]|nr:sodium:calcium antiporter [Gammaproteobacteria bacterium]
MFLPIVGLIIGIALLVWSADEFTDSGARIAKLFQISPLVIGLVIFGFGTSAPELLVTGVSSFEGNAGIGIGNAVGSNIFNIALVLAICVIILPIHISKTTIKREWFFQFIAVVIAGYVLFDNFISLIDGVILASFFGLFLIYSFKTAKNTDMPKVEIGNKKDQSKVWLMLIFTLIVLMLSAKLVVWSGQTLAESFGVPDLIIGLTLIALGTSLPELAVSVSSAIKKQHEMLLGNILGSNLFNTLAVLSLPGLIRPTEVDKAIMSRDYPVMLLVALLIVVLAYRRKGEYRLGKVSGVILLVVLTLYLMMLVKDVL